VIDILIPPSIPMILYAVVSGVSIGDLFMAGVLPGLLMAAGFVGVCWWEARRLGLGAEAPPLDLRRVVRLAVLAIPALILPVLILIALRFWLRHPDRDRRYGGALRARRELVNLKTAEALGVTVATSVLLLADEVIE
jgi:TRAP-type mannitol/chloroaromatic compound transport system permease large subunit